MVNRNARNLNQTSWMKRSGLEILPWKESALAMLLSGVLTAAASGDILAACAAPPAPSRIVSPCVIVNFHRSSITKIAIHYIDIYHPP
ncbi:hypothetical protein BDV11DRAFT_193323 [Aspergillus similis]